MYRVYPFDQYSKCIEMSWHEKQHSVTISILISLLVLRVIKFQPNSKTISIGMHSWVQQLELMYNDISAVASKTCWCLFNRDRLKKNTFIWGRILMRRSIISKFIVLTSCHKVLSVISSTLFGLPWNTSSPYRDINVSCNIYKYVKKHM